ncbi:MULTISPECIES: hypothetical protein [Priestia]|uniref:Uncharacterized protein n=1 Tax=Priestia megaterium (strain WSH-002) TaxID=1006007 RepID=A0A8D4BKP4_PRIMW|nr:MULTISPECIES: hypothetical protein [Priestia]AEN89691.1 hypothetical protein BMWSH_2809 [Priestia megaterium WSH-002]PHF77486.1 hypothetical protein COI42_03595 [Priestia aryabhattai]
MSEKLGITKIYSQEILEIGNKLKDLENRRVYELSGAQMDGYLSTNVIKLRKMIKDLIIKIDNQDPSATDELDELF